MNLKIAFIGFLLILNQNLLSQGENTIKSIQASSDRVDVRVGEDYFAKGGWHLDPLQNPDIFKIGSKWNYDTLKVSFITDLDSITIHAQPNSTYDFVIFLVDKPCHIQVQTSPNPILMNWESISFLSLIFLIIIVLITRIKDLKNTRRLLLFGYVSPFLFWSFTLIAGNFQSKYDHLKNVISELGTLGSDGEIFTSSSLIVISCFSLIFSIGFIKSSQVLKISKLPSISSFVFPISTIWAAIFPLGNEFHGLLGPLPLILILGIISSLYFWRGNQFNWIRKCSMISLILLLMIGLRFVPSFGQEYEGLIQRFFYLGWTIWTITIAFDLQRKLNVK